jgi:hypothetical protein
MKYVSHNPLAMSSPETLILRRQLIQEGEREKLLRIASACVSQ